MIHEELKQLESIYLQLNNAYYNGDKYKMKSLFDNFTKQFPQYNLSKQNNIFEVFEEHGENQVYHVLSILLKGVHYYIILKDV